jgi:hypothetical protein
MGTRVDELEKSMNAVIAQTQAMESNKNDPESSQKQ